MQNTAQAVPAGRAEQAWVSHTCRHVSFSERPNYEKLVFPNHQELMQYVLRCAQRDYRVG